MDSMLMLALVAVASASPGTERDAWPALPSEQPVVVARGWWQLDGGVVVGDRAEGDLAARFGALRGFEVSAGLRSEAGRLAAPALGARAALAVREAPSRSAAVTVDLAPPWADEPGDGALGLTAAAATAPFLWSAAARATWSAGGLGADSELGALLQVGPLAPFAGLSVAPLGATASGGFQLNASRGVAVRLSWLRPVAGVGPRAFTAHLRVAL